ncbi:methyltransferase, FkbM family protein [Pseudooceanicola batsensis HTCC2597]|uniref:Methyltransferase, FkbM family protein n=1 Tax=Pseudooceanicola batsensis (strain ATCC BAA-863 / DSM 15984 / KCTC 12145 / HTCC2597) TaxID=252305 RepID=A3U1S5_PSEBH|nr:FkbM family methyltransferase [Pseudooceanicola batsensis]EAQ01859.1 methyltransferase, FkbM family protein [Pseudooceanicola batsensis HTCC2597]
MTTTEEFPDHSEQFPGSSDPLKRAELAEMGRPSHVTSHGVRFPTDMPPLFPRVRNLLAHDEYEERETKAALKVVRAGDRVVELGAGIGYMSAIVAKNCAPSQVHAFEANPALIPCIRRVHSENALDNITVHHALLDEERGSRKFYVRRNFVASSTDREPMQGVVDIADVPVLPARQTIATLAPDVLICDIEGAEVYLLPQFDLSQVRVAIVELHPQHIGLNGVKTVFDTMHAGGLVYNPRRSMAKVVTFSRPE